MPGRKHLLKIMLLLFMMLIYGIPSSALFSTNNEMKTGKHLYNSETTQTGKIKIRGKITDNSGEPLTGVSIVEDRTNNGTISDIDGNYVLEVTSNSTVRFSYLGFVQQTLTVKDDGVFNIVLEEDYRNLDEVVVVG